MQQKVSRTLSVFKLFFISLSLSLIYLFFNSLPHLHAMFPVIFHLSEHLRKVHEHSLGHGVSKLSRAHCSQTNITPVQNHHNTLHDVCMLQKKKGKPLVRAHV